MKPVLFGLICSMACLSGIALAENEAIHPWRDLGKKRLVLLLIMVTASFVLGYFIAI